MIQRSTPPQLVIHAANSPLPPRGDLLFHAVLLLLAAATLTTACLLEVRGREQVVVSLLDYPLPGTCTYRQWLSSDCPGCGLTRCFVSMVHGDWSKAWSFHPVGSIFFLIVAGQLPYRACQIWRIRTGKREWCLPWASSGLLWALIAAFFLQWMWRTVSAIAG